MINFSIMGFETPRIYFFAANLVFIITSIICGYIRCTHMCPEFKANESYHYPARCWISGTFISMVMEFPYLMDVSSFDAFLYVRAWGLLVLPICSLLIIDRYFFFIPITWRHFIKIGLLPVVILLFLFFFALKGGDALSGYSLYIRLLVLGFFAYLALMVGKSLHRLRRESKQKDEQEYSKVEEFPSELTRMLLIIIPCLLGVGIIVTFLIDSRWVKMVRDLVFSIFEVRFLCVILASNRPNSTNNEVDAGEYANEQMEEGNGIAGKTNKRQHCRLTDEQSQNLCNDIIELLTSEHLYRNSELKLTDLVALVGSNRSYVSESISRSRYTSFYKLINCLRVEYAMRLKMKNPSMKQQDIAEQSGFSSRYTLSKTIKEWKNGNIPTLEKDIADRL